jgi:hypothetical protein
MTSPLPDDSVKDSLCYRAHGVIDVWPRKNPDVLLSLKKSSEMSLQVPDLAADVGIDIIGSSRAAGCHGRTPRPNPSRAFSRTP